VPATLVLTKDRIPAFRPTGRAVGRAVGRAEGERGAAAVEYALLVALIAVAIIGTLVILGVKVNNTYTCVGNSMPTGSSSTPSSAC
jgi:pilus assembly protein Flp/PilA